MKTAKLKYLISAAIVIFLLTGSAWADGQRGRDHGGAGPGYHQGHQQHQGKHFKGPAPHQGPRHFGPGYHHGPKYRSGPSNHWAPRHHRGYAYPYPGHRHPRHPAYLSQAPGAGYGLHFSILDPYFAFGFSTGGHW